MSSPHLSIIVCFRDRARFIEETVRSLMRDPFFPRSQIVFVDNSTDGSAKNIPWLPNAVRTLAPPGLSIAHYLNLGLALAEADCLTIFDSDDILASEALTWRMRYLLDNPGELAVGGDIQDYIDETGQTILTASKEDQKDHRLTREGISARKWSLCGLPFFIFRRELITKVGKLDESLRCAHDLDFLFRALKFTSIPWFARPVLKYRVHAENTTLVRENGGIRSRPEVRAESFLVQTAHRQELNETPSN